MSDRDDPTKVRNQPSLTVSTGRVWLVMGAVTLVVYGAVLLAVAHVSLTVPLFAVLLDVVLYAGMVAARFALPGGRGRLRTLAALFGAMSVVSLAALMVVILAGPPSA